MRAELRKSLPRFSSLLGPFEDIEVEDQGWADRKDTSRVLDVFRRLLLCVVHRRSLHPYQRGILRFILK